MASLAVEKANQPDVLVIKLHQNDHCFIDNIAMKCNCGRISSGGWLHGEPYKSTNLLRKGQLQLPWLAGSCLINATVDDENLFASFLRLRVHVHE